ncbi:hypothetical protein TSMEX_007965 [Taenia solium]|eukprot:TsM_000358400 transcript=TsM_000358400 gene=TsM_000358400
MESCITAALDGCEPGRLDSRIINLGLCLNVNLSTSGLCSFPISAQDH